MLVEAFRTWVTEMVTNHPGMRHELRDTGSSINLEFPKRGSSGFDVSIAVSETLVAIETDHGWHHHAHDATEQELAHLFGLVRDLLSSNMRMRELRAGGMPYRWHIEAYLGCRWVREATTGLLFWNYLGKRSEAIFQNDTLPPRPLGTG